MLNDRSNTAKRRIVPVGVVTPLLIPSFSSRGFPRLAELFESLRNDLYGSCLVSAFDLASGRLSVELNSAADLVILDSGVYETKPLVVAADGQFLPPAPDDWSRDAYRESLKIVRADTNVIAVSFDWYGEVARQLDLAIEDFSFAPTAASDFLLKPIPPDGLIRPEMLVGEFSRLASLNVLGVTERELGFSLLRRCETLVAIRQVLGAAGLELPVHVFGTITPGMVLSYFFCGADIFDGLNWLRYSFGRTDVLATSELALHEGDWEASDLEVGFRHTVRNLRYLCRLQEAMRCYAEDKDLSAICAKFPVAARAAQVAAAAGANLAHARLD